MHERNLIRDYAREEAAVTKAGMTLSLGMRGEMAGKTFIALQRVLDIVEHSEAVNEFGSPAVATSVIREEIRKAFE